MEDRENAMEDKGCLSYQKPGDRPAMVPSLEHSPLTPWLWTCSLLNYETACLCRLSRPHVALCDRSPGTLGLKDRKGLAQGHKARPHSWDSNPAC